MQNRANEVLIIGTYGIDVFYGIVDEMERRDYLVFTATDSQIAKEYLQNRRFDAIIINLEPDGKGGVAEEELLKTIMNSSMQGQSVCLGVSAHYPHSLPAKKEEKHLQVLAGWLTLPVKANVLADHIVELIESPHKLSIAERLEEIS